MTILQATILGLIQGIAEFLPISSSGHLILIPSLFGWQLQDLAFDVVLHLATALAVLIYFYKDWLRMVQSMHEDINVSKVRSWTSFSIDTKLLLTILVVSAPVAIVGVLFGDFIEEFFRSPPLVATMLILVSFVMLSADRYAKSISTKKNLGFFDALLISLSQIVALTPGTSRSGITISAGLFRGLSRAEAAKFSFLLGTPIIIGGGLMKLTSLLYNPATDVMPLAVGFVTAFISGFFAIKWLLKFLATESLNVFIVYRILLGITILIFWFNRF